SRHLDNASESANAVLNMDDIIARCDFGEQASVIDCRWPTACGPPRLRVAEDLGIGEDDDGLAARLACLGRTVWQLPTTSQTTSDEGDRAGGGRSLHILDLVGSQTVLLEQRGESSRLLRDHDDSSARRG